MRLLLGISMLAVMASGALRFGFRPLLGRALPKNLGADVLRPTPKDERPDIGSLPHTEDAGNVASALRTRV